MRLGRANHLARGGSRRDEAPEAKGSRPADAPRGQALGAGPGLVEGVGRLDRSDDAGQVLVHEVVDEPMDGTGVIHDRQDESERRRADGASHDLVAVHDRREIWRRLVLGRVGLDVRADAEDEVVLCLVRLEEGACALEVRLDRRRTLDAHRPPAAGRRRVPVGWLVVAVDCRPLSAPDTREDTRALDTVGLKWCGWTWRADATADGPPV